MPIFSTFDINLKQERVAYFIQKFGADKVLLIERSFLFAMIKVFLPAIGYLVVVGLIIRLTTLISGPVVKYIGIPASIIFLLVMIARLYVIYFDYLLDFTIVTPEEVVSYNQTGFLKRGINTLQTAKIKSVSIQKSGLLFSLFNNGNITFFAEGDQANGQGEVRLTRVERPEEAKSKVLMIVEIAKSITLDPNSD